ncbi:hypothetical protein [Psychroflexus sediminis]|uniref:Uncharacterized protein n=1 Tax=Psychroflexus sediminis TaxID=470826 RepID=A0A1G7WW72_9FLAO|nr:hypothetical protein [Psychroflexus sediminis]SDG76192.1 hypothetical protein SAMN04488027_106172 [Psychroflexus sediminis]
MARPQNIHQKRSGFRIPKDYFSSLEASVLTNLKSDTYSKKTGFETPKAYLADFKLETPSEEKQTRVIRLKEMTKWIAAASIVAFAIVGAMYIDEISPKKDIQFSDLNNDMIERYLDTHLDSPDEFIDYENTSVKKLVEENITTLEDKDIIEYLNDKLEDQDFDND